MAVTTFAAIDIGSYYISMEIFELSKKDGIRSLSRIRQNIELGRDTYALKKISVERIAEMTEILTDFQRIMKEFDVSGYRACAKSALREARNRYLVLDHIYRATGINIEILSNSEQRFLGYKSIASQGDAFKKYIEKGTAIVDVGGGSIQVSVFDKDTLVSTQNLPLGSLRIRERLGAFEHETIHYDRLVDELINKDIANYKRMFLKNRKITNMILVGDYFTNLIFQNRADLSKNVTRDVFLTWYDHVMANAPRDVAEELGIPTEMSSILIPTAVLYRKLIDELQIENIWLPGIQLMDGIAYDYGEKNRMIHQSHDFDRDILMAARHMSRRFGSNKAHNEVLVGAAGLLFDSIRKYAGMEPRSGLLLQVACYLHDVGKYISFTDVAGCSYHIIMSSEIIGISERERRIIANVVRHNTQSLGYYKEASISDELNPDDFMLVAQLAAIMRLANCLDQSYRQKMKSLRIARKDAELVLTVETDEDYTLEKGIFLENVSFFEEIFGLRPVLKLKNAR